MSTETKLRQDRWRVRKLRVYSGDSARPFYANAWGIYPPSWDIDGSPLLAYRTHAQALRGAASRADFAAIPPMAQEDWESLDLPVVEEWAQGVGGPWVGWIASGDDNEQ